MVEMVRDGGNKIFQSEVQSTFTLSLEYTDSNLSRLFTLPRQTLETHNSFSLCMTKELQNKWEKEHRHQDHRTDYKEADQDISAHGYNGLCGTKSTIGRPADDTGN